MEPIERADFDAELIKRGFREWREDDADDVSRKHWTKQCFKPGCGKFVEYHDDPTQYDAQALGLELENVKRRDCGHNGGIGSVP